jgi:hypothetical protein
VFTGIIAKFGDQCNQIKFMKVNGWCGLFCDLVAGPFFFVESTITGGTYQDMFETHFPLPHKLKTWRQKLGIQ